MIKFRIVEVDFCESERLLTEDMSANLMNSIYQNVHWLANYFKNYKNQQVLRKFRVDVQYPRSMKANAYGHFKPGVVYVFANSSGEAKQKAMDQLRNRLEPDETQDRHFKSNYLRDIKKIHVKPKAVEVKSWQDFVKLIHSIAADKKQAPYPLLHVEDNEIEIFLKKMRNDPNFKKTLSKEFNDKELQVIRKLYRHVGDNIDHMSDEIKDLYDPSLKSDLRDVKGSNRPVGEKFKDSDWGYWSVYEPENSEYDFSKLNTFHDIIAYAKKWGIYKKDLDQMVKDHYSEEDRFYKEEVSLYKQLRKQLRVSSNNKIFEDDPWSKKWTERGIDWSILALDIASEFRELLGHFNVIDIQRDEFGNEKATGDDNQETELIDFLWDFYKKGYPQRRTSFEKYKTVLEQMLEYRRKIKQKKKEKEETPF